MAAPIRDPAPKTGQAFSKYQGVVVPVYPGEDTNRRRGQSTPRPTGSDADSDAATHGAPGLPFTSILTKQESWAQIAEHDFGSGAEDDQPDDYSSGGRLAPLDDPPARIIA